MPEKQRIENPIIPGFHPDPDIIRVGEDYYIATTTFEWYPGVSIHHSRDLANWELIGYALDERHLGELAVAPDSGGNYIPSLLHHKGTFYLVYSLVFDGQWPHVTNRSYLTTATDIRGPWSEPIYLNSTAFDPAFFIDEDDTHYLINLEMETRPGKGPQMRGFSLQEYCPKKQSLLDSPKRIHETDDWDLALEGPHIYKHGGYYYIMSAMNGTQFNHGTHFLRSKDIWGPYESAPNAPMLSSREDPSNPLQKAGQGCLVETPQGQWYLAHHVGRPVLPQRRCPLGRETCLQRIEWGKDGWPVLATGGISPKAHLPLPTAHTWQPLGGTQAKAAFVVDGFSSEKLHLEWNTLREAPHKNWLRHGPHNSGLSLRGRQPIGAKYQQSLLARRWTSLDFEACTQLDYAPTHPRQMAGLMCYYDSKDFAYAYLSWDEDKGRVLHMLHKQGHLDWYNSPQLAEPISIKNKGYIELQVNIKHSKMQFSYREDESADWLPLGEPLDATTLSDEGSDGKKMAFTGAYVGLAAHDPVQEKLWARFKHFTLHNRNI